MSADKVAKKGYHALMQGKPVVVPGVFNKMQVFSLRFLPRRIVLWIMRSVQEKRR
jgi:short-subunit dehydrogenase